MKSIFIVYIIILIGSHLGISETNFIRPDGLWNLVPFRVGGWEPPFFNDRICEINWSWENILKNNSCKSQ